MISSEAGLVPDGTVRAADVKPLLLDHVLGPSSQRTRHDHGRHLILEFLRQRASAHRARRGGTAAAAVDWTTPESRVRSVDHRPARGHIGSSRLLASAYRNEGWIWTKRDEPATVDVAAVAETRHALRRAAQDTPDAWLARASR